MNVSAKWHSIARTAVSAIFALLSLTVTAQAQEAWKNVQISAGSGFVTGIVAQPKVHGLFYLRTDVDGFYRWDAPMYLGELLNAN